MKCIPLEKLIDDWATESQIDMIQPGNETIRFAVLHSKYATQIAAHSISLKLKKFDFLQKKKLKVEYYSGRLSEEQLKENGWKPFQFVLKSDINNYIESDDDLIKMSKSMMANEEAIAFCTTVCKELTSRTFQLREFMAWEKFIRGQK